jgi:SNF2 family DNA or RNA helicase
LTKGLVSYYKGAPTIAYPKLIFKTVECTMGEFQKSSYIMTLTNNKKTLKSYDMFDITENSFYIKSRMVSNIAFPNQRLDKTGYIELVKELTSKNIKIFSSKFFMLIENIKNSTNKIFIYSNFILSGLQSISLILDLLGYKNYIKHGPGLKRYCIWSGNESKEIKEKIKTEFNKIENLNGSLIQIFLGSPAAKEGITLKNVREVHIMEPYWNLSRIKQIMGRAHRHCVHNDLPEDERIVTVYLYLSNHIDEHIWSLAKNKDKIIREFENCLKNNAIDCDIFYNRNNSLKNPINCNL